MALEMVPRKHRSTLSGIVRGWLVIIVPLLFSATLAHAQGRAPQHVLIVPETTVERLEDISINAHTNHLIIARPNFTGTAPSGETPQSLRPV